MSLYARIDESAGLAHGDCEHVAPHVFAIDGDVAEIVGPATDAELRAAARACPAGAIALFDTATDEEVDP